MSPLHWLSVCCFVVCGWCAGDSFHQQAQAHLEALRKTLDLVETLHQEISFRRSSRQITNGFRVRTGSRFQPKGDFTMEFFNAAVDVMKTVVVALGGGLGVWGAVNLLEGYGGDNPSANAHVR